MKSYFQRVIQKQRLSKEDLACILFFFIVFSIVYSFYVFIPFGTYDDYERASEYSQAPQSYSVELLKTHIVDGRFLNGVVLWLLFKPKSISYFGIYRLMNLLLLIIFAFALFSVLRKKNDRLESFLLTIIICTLPSFLIIFYFVSLMGVIGGAISAFLSIYVVNQLDKVGTPIQKALIFLLASLLLFVAVQFYQPIAMFYWVFAAISLVNNYREAIQPQLTKLLQYLTVFLFSMSAAYVFLRFAPELTGLAYKSRTAILGQEEIINKFLWFTTEPLRESMNFFLLPSIPRQLFLVAIGYITAGLFFFFSGSILQRLIKTIVLILLIPLSYFPNLVVSENWASYRSMIALSAIWVILIYFSSQGYVKLLPPNSSVVSLIGKSLLVVWAFLAITASIYNSTTYLVIPSFLEHRFIRYKITELQPKVGDTIYVVLSGYRDSSSPYFYADEFGVPATAYPWGAENLTYLVLKEFGIEPDEVHVISVDSPEKVPFSEPHAHLLDLREKKEFEMIPTMYPVERAKILIHSLFK